jgi:hypothetical protein
VLNLASVVGALSRTIFTTRIELPGQSMFIWHMRGNENKGESE